MLCPLAHKTANAYERACHVKLGIDGSVSCTRKGNFVRFGSDGARLVGLRPEAVKEVDLMMECDIMPARS